MHDLQNQLSQSKWYVTLRLCAILSILIYLLMVSFTGYIRQIESNQTIISNPQTTTLLSSEETVGQTFVTRRMGFNCFEVFLQPEKTGTGEIHLRLREHPVSGSTEDLAVASLPLATISHPDWYLFSFTPQRDSWQRDYYALLEIDGTGSVRVGTTPGDTYLDGALYHNNTPMDAQMAFRTGFFFPILILCFFNRLIMWFYVLSVGAFIYILPGWVLLILLWPGSRNLTWAELLGLSSGVSLALYPLLLLWTNLIGLHLGLLYVWIPTLAALLTLVWLYRTWRPPTAAQAWQLWTQSASFWPDLAWIVVTGLVISTRFLAIDSLEAPMWGDSYQHTMIAQLIVYNGGLFDSWEPYAELQTFTYHFGFHTAVAVLHWITGFALPQATLWTGQILSILAVLALYPLAVRVGGNQWAGVGAILIAGLLSPMPMFYVNWGRYTQLAGQVILMSIVYLYWNIIKSKTLLWPLLLLLTISLSGLALTHYRVLIFFLCFGFALLLIGLLQKKGSYIIYINLILFISNSLLFLPWFFSVFAGKIPLVFATQMTTVVTSSSFTQTYNTIGNLSLYLPKWLWVLLFFGIIWGLWQYKTGSLLIILWWSIIILATNPHWLHLPGTGVITNFAVFIAVYIPAGILLGSSIGWLKNRLHFLRNSFLLLLLTTLIGSWGSGQRLDNLQRSQYILVTKADVRGFDWIRTNTRQDVQFLVNSFFAYGDTVIVGSDGGWWIPLLASRKTTLPPLNYGVEQGLFPEYREWVNAMLTEIHQKGLDHPEVQHLLHTRGITHVYIGQRQGSINTSNVNALQPEQLLSSPHFHLRYHQDRVWIFEIV